MLVRLAFSVMIQVDADILLIDEVLAVGDAAFQQKCFEEFERIKRVEHHRPARHPRHGRGRALLRPGDAARARPPGRRSAARIGSAMRYLQLNFAEEARARGGRANEADRQGAGARRQAERAMRLGDGAARSPRRGSSDEHGARTRVLQGGTPRRRSPRACASTRTWRTRSSRSASRTVTATHVFSATTQLAEPHAGLFAAGEEATVRFSFDNVLAPDRYRATPSHRPARLRHGLDRLARAEAEAVVRSRSAPAGVVPARRDPRRARRTRGGVGVSVDVAAELARIERVGTEVTGPTALGDSPRRLWTADLDARRHRLPPDVLRLGPGLPVELMRPLALFGVLYVVFTRVPRLRRATCPSTRSRCCWASSSTASSARRRGLSVRSLVTRENLVRKIDFPRLAVPLASVPDRAVQPAAEPRRRVRLPPGVRRARRALGWLEMPILIVLLVALRARAVDAAVDAVRALPRRRADLGRRPADHLLRHADLLSDRARCSRRRTCRRWRTCIMLNPFAAILQQARHAVHRPAAPLAAEAIGGTALRPRPARAHRGA